MKSKPIDFWDSFTEALTKQGEKRPDGKGWKQPAELATRWKLPVRLAAKKLNAGKKAGILEHFDGFTYRDGKLRRTTWYRPTP